MGNWQRTQSKGFHSHTSECALSCMALWRLLQPLFLHATGRNLHSDACAAQGKYCETGAKHADTRAAHTFRWCRTASVKPIHVYASQAHERGALDGSGCSSFQHLQRLRLDCGQLHVGGEGICKNTETAAPAFDNRAQPHTHFGQTVIERRVLRARVGAGGCGAFDGGSCAAYLARGIKSREICGSGEQALRCGVYVGDAAAALPLSGARRLKCSVTSPQQEEGMRGGNTTAMLSSLTTAARACKLTCSHVSDAISISRSSAQLVFFFFPGASRPPLATAAAAAAGCCGGSAAAVV